MSESLLSFATSYPGRVVLEDPIALLAALQKTVTASKLERNIRGSLVDHLLDERKNDRSLG